MYNQYYPRVVQAIATNDYKVYAYFDDGSIKCFDMSVKVNSGVFQKIKDINIFKGALTVLNETIAWDLKGNNDPRECIDIDPFTIYEGPDVAESEFIKKVAVSNS